MGNLTDWKARPAAQPVTLQGHHVTIVPYERAIHQNVLWHAFGGEATNQLLAWFAAPDFHSCEEFGDWLASVKAAGWLGHVFYDRASGNVVGMAHYMRADPLNGVVEVGGVAHSPSMQRSPLSTEVHYLMARHVFEDLGYRRYEWKCNNGNAASKIAAERLGFSFEGIFRNHMISRGSNRDTAWFAMVDEDWPKIRAAFEAWLSLDNFEHDGSQKHRLEDIRKELTRKFDER